MILRARRLRPRCEVRVVELPEDEVDMGSVCGTAASSSVRITSLSSSSSLMISGPDYGSPLNGDPLVSYPWKRQDRRLSPLTFALSEDPSRAKRLLQSEGDA